MLIEERAYGDNIIEVIGSLIALAWSTLRYVFEPLYGLFFTYLTN